MSNISELVNKREFQAAYDVARQTIAEAGPEWTEPVQQAYHMGAIAASFVYQYDQARAWWDVCYRHATDAATREDVRRDIALSDIRSGQKTQAQESVEALLNEPATDANRDAIRWMVQGNLARLLGNLADADGLYTQGLAAFDGIDTDVVNKQWARNTAYRGLLNAALLGSEGGTPHREMTAYGEDAQNYAGEPDPSEKRTKFVAAILDAFAQGGYAQARQVVEAQESMV